MTDREELERRLRQNQAHIAALTESLNDANRQNVQLRAQVKEVTEAGARSVKAATDYIDALHNRIEAMVDEWQAQLRHRFQGTEGELAELDASVEAFRPQRTGKATVE
jgi:septal ring factor EnvC (AmiA/AmiB activator)